MPQIWLDPETFQQQAGQIWAQGMHAQLQAGQDWAQGALQQAVQPIQDSLSKLQSMVPQVPTAPTTPAPSPTQAPTPAPTPTPTPVPTPPPPIAPPPPPPGATPTAEPTPAAAPAPAGALPTPPPAAPTPTAIAPTPPAPTPSPSDTGDVGQNWANEQIKNLLGFVPGQQVPQPTNPAAAALPGVTGTTPAAPAAAAAPAPVPTPAPTPSTSAEATPGALPNVTRWSDLITAAADKYGLPASTIAGIIEHESGGDPNAGLSNHPTGAIGLGQIEPETWQGLGLGDPSNRTDPAQNIDGMAKLLAANLKQYGGDMNKALMAYYWPAGISQPDAPGPGGQPSANTVLAQFKDDISHYLGMDTGAPQQPSSGGAAADAGSTKMTDQSAAANLPKPNDQGQIWPLLGNSNNDPHATYHLEGGSDLMAPRGTPVLAMHAGKVDYVNQEDGSHAAGGNAVEIHGSDGLDYYYAHFDQPTTLKVGDTVDTGQQIGQVGNTGNAWKGGDGPTHLHIGIGHGIATGVGAAGGLGENFNAQDLLSSLRPTDQQVAAMKSGATDSGLTMGQNQPASPDAVPKFGTGAQGLIGSQAQANAAVSSAQDLGTRLVNQVLSGGQDLTNALLNQQTQNIKDAVLNVGGLGQGPQDLLNQGRGLLGQGAQSLEDLLNQPTQSVEDTLRSNALLSQGIPTGVSQATSALPSYLQNLAGGAGTAGQDLLGMGQQALSDFNTNLQQPASLTSNPTMWALQNLINPQITAPAPWDPDQQALRDSAMQKLMGGQADQVLPSEQRALNQLGQVFGLAGPEAELAQPAVGDQLTARGYGATDPATFAARASDRAESGRGAFIDPGGDLHEVFGRDHDNVIDSIWGADTPEGEAADNALVRVRNTPTEVSVEVNGQPTAAQLGTINTLDTAAGNKQFYFDLRGPDGSRAASGQGVTDFRRAVTSIYPSGPEAELAPSVQATRMFHGTASDFPSEAVQPSGEQNLYGPGYYLTSSPEVAGGIVRKPYFDVDPATGRISTYDAATGKFDTYMNPGGQVQQPGYAQARVPSEADLQARWQGLHDAAIRAGTPAENILPFEDWRDRQAGPSVGPNVRAVDVPNDLNLFDVRQTLPTSIQDRLNEIAGQNYGSDLSDRLAEQDYSGSGDNYWHNLVGTLRDYGVQQPMTAANDILEQAGYEGIAHEGGKFGGMTDATGNPVKHEVNVLFPSGLERTRNAISGTQGGQANVPFALGLGAAGLAGLAGASQPVRDMAGQILQQALQPHLTGLAPVLQGLAGAAPWDPDQQALRDSAMQKYMHGQADQVTPDEQKALNQLGWTVGLSGPNLGGNPATPISLGDWVKSAYRGGVISSMQTAADVAFNSALTPALSGGAGLARDAAAFAPSRAAGRVLGAQSGLVNWANNFMQGLSDSFARPGSITANAAPGVPTVLSRLTTGMGALHGGFQGATAGLLDAMERGAAAGDAASSRAGGSWFSAFHSAFTSPTAETIARAQGLGARAAGTAELGNAANAMASAIQKAGPIGDALFPVFRMGMNFVARRVEASPLGLIGTGADVLQGMAGKGPYADIAKTGLGGAFDVIPQPRTPGGTAAVGPLGERLANNLIGTTVGVGLWLANQAIGGTITGAGPTDPAQAAVWRANGNQPYSYRPPGSDQSYSYMRLPPQLSGPLMAAGAYADAYQAYTEASSRAGTAAGSSAYNVENPLMAAAARLITEVGQDTLSPTPLQTIASLYDTLTSSGDTALQASTRGASDILSNVAGGLVPESGLVRSIANMSDPYQRATLQPTQWGQIPQAVAEQVQSNIPGLREGLPVRPDLLGRPTLNPLAGPGGALPIRPGAGQASPILQAMENAGVTGTAPPKTTPVGQYQQVALTPAEQRAWTQLHGQLLQQVAGQMASDPSFRSASPAVQRLELQRADQIATRVADKEMLGQLGPDALRPAYAGGRLEVNPNSVLAPVAGYGPNVMANQQMLQQQLQAYQAQALLNSIMGGAGAQPSSQQRLQALLANQG